MINSEEDEDFNINLTRIPTISCDDTSHEILVLPILFSNYITTQKRLEKDPSNSNPRKMVKIDTGLNENGEKVNQCIQLYVDNQLSIGANILPTNFYMGKDAALSTVATNGVQIINQIRDYAGLARMPIPRITRDDAADAWNAGLDGLTSITQDSQAKKAKTAGNIPKILKAFMGNIPFVKAIMDSACLGETVCVSILYGLCESMRNNPALLPNDNIPRLPQSFYTVNPPPLTTEDIEVLQFLLRMSYCDVFELVSSDVLGAVNGLYSVRAIHNSLPSVSYVSIPRAG
jgi:hypothetical protein